MKISTATMWAIFWIGAGSFVPLLFLQYVGEEGVYAIATQEMHTTGDLLHPTLYGQPFGRPGLYCWLILPLIRVLGQQHVLIAARLIAISSTLLIGLTLAWLVCRIFNDRMLAAFAAATFLSGDVLLYRGWLAYVDPLFSFLTFGAMSALWVAIEERRRALLFFAVLGVIGSFLAKALTGYIFYGVFALVLVWRHGNRRFLFSPWSITLHGVAVAFPFVWSAIVGDSVVWAMLDQVLYNAKHDSTFDAAEFAKLLVAFPFRTFLYLLPTSAVVLYGLLSKEIAPSEFRQNSVADRASGRRDQCAALLARARQQPAIFDADLSVCCAGDGLRRPQRWAPHLRSVREGLDRDRRNSLRGRAGGLSSLRAPLSWQLRQGRPGDHRPRRQFAYLCDRRHVHRPKHCGGHQHTPLASAAGYSPASRICFRRRLGVASRPGHRAGRDDVHPRA